MVEIQENRVKIERYETGFVITITEKNWIKTGHFVTPCYIKWNGQNVELHNDYLVYHGEDQQYLYDGIEFQQKLPRLLEYGELIPRDKDNNPIFDLTNTEK